MPANVSHPPARSHRQAASTARGHRAARATTAAVLALMAAAAPTLIHQPSQPASSISAHTPASSCHELCGLAGGSSWGLV
jgi:hypothetical protein